MQWYKSCDPFPRLNPHTVNFFCSERQHTKRKKKKGRAGTTWKCVVDTGLLLWARRPLMRGKNAQQEAALTRTMPVILSNMNHLPSNTNKYCSNTSGSLRFKADSGLGKLWGIRAPHTSLHNSHPASHSLLNPTPDLSAWHTVCQCYGLCEAVNTGLVTAYLLNNNRSRNEAQGISEFISALCSCVSCSHESRQGTRDQYSHLSCRGMKGW